MEEFIIGETTKIFSKAIKRYAKLDFQNQLDVSLLLNLETNEDGERAVAYQVCNHHQPVKKIKIMDVLGVLIDLKGYSLLVPPQIKKIIENFEVEMNSKNCEVCVYLDREDENEVMYFLYKDGSLVRKFELHEVLKLELA
jgi:hypothetical protein